MNRFFIATPLGFEATAYAEIKHIWPFLLGKDAKPNTLELPTVEVLKGGLELETELHLGLQLNFFIKSANRILLRLDSFKARDFPKFYQRMCKLPWNEFLHHSHVEWKVSAETSRLNNEKRLQESGEKALEDILGKSTSGEPCATVFVRVSDDQCTISLDTSGEHLHKRGWTVLKSDAPLRETIASFALLQMSQDRALSDLSGIELVDPMMGAGTFLTEARALGSGQFQRPFAFQKWKKTPKIFLSPTFALNYSLPVQNPFGAYLGCDIVDRMADTARKNFAQVEEQLSSVQKKKFAAAQVSFLSEDALEVAPACTLSERWMISNPPYGDRLPLAADGLTSLVGLLVSKWKPQRIGILYPESDKLKKAPKGYRLDAEIPLNNGGLRVLFTVLSAV